MLAQVTQFLCCRFSTFLDAPSGNQVQFGSAFPAPILQLYMLDTLHREQCTNQILHARASNTFLCCRFPTFLDSPAGNQFSLAAPLRPPFNSFICWTLSTGSSASAKSCNPAQVTQFLCCRFPTFLDSPTGQSIQFGSAFAAPILQLYMLTLSTGSSASAKSCNPAQVTQFLCCRFPTCFP